MPCWVRVPCAEALCPCLETSPQGSRAVLHWLQATHLWLTLQMSPLLWACEVVSFLALLQHVDEYNICLRQQAQITLVTTVQIKAKRIMARLLMDLHGPVFYWPHSVFLTKAYAC